MTQDGDGTGNNEPGGGITNTNTVYVAPGAVGWYKLKPVLKAPDFST